MAKLKKQIKEQKKKVEKLKAAGKEKKADKANKKLGFLKLKRNEKISDKLWEKTLPLTYSEEQKAADKAEIEKFEREQLEQELADYETQKERIAQDKQTLEENYQKSLAEGNWDKARYIKSLFGEYTTAADNFVKDKDISYTQLAGGYAPMRSVNTSYGDRGLLRSGAREAAQQYELENAQHQYGAVNDTNLGGQALQSIKQGYDQSQTGYARQLEDINKGITNVNTNFQNQLPILQNQYVNQQEKSYNDQKIVRPNAMKNYQNQLGKYKKWQSNYGQYNYKKFGGKAPDYSTYVNQYSYSPF